LFKKPHLDATGSGNLLHMLPGTFVQNVHRIEYLLFFHTFPDEASATSFNHKPQIFFREPSMALIS